MLPANYLERVYAGFFGKNVGIQLGAPVESVIWTRERIQAVFGDDIRGYLRPYKTFGADDDANGPAYFFRVLQESDDPDVADFGRAWLDYAREGKGFFWWGGVGQSTSHTAYYMLKNGASAPIGREALEGVMKISEGIGGQIFVDTIGLCLPGEPERAADLGGKLASVAYYGEAVYGGRFMAAAVAAAFGEPTVEAIVARALDTIPADSDYARVANAVIAFHRAYPRDWQGCFAMLERDWGYDRYSGICPMIPNAGVCILSLLYGAGDFNRTVEIATLCGWDTDCNAGNVGTILGVFCGMEGIADTYIGPMYDTAILSGVSGYLNICDLPSFAREVALCGYRMMGQELPAGLPDPGKGLAFDFSLPKSTHGFRVSHPFYLQIANRAMADGRRGLQVLFNRLQKGNECRLFFKPFFTRADFEDARYSPVFTPKVWPGQRLTIRLFKEQWTGAEPMTVTPYVRTAFDGRIFKGEGTAPENNAWQEIVFDIPDVENGLIDEAGLIVTSHSVNTSDFASRDLGRFFIGSVHVTGNAAYAIDMAKAKTEFGCLTPFSHNRGLWTVEGDGMKVIAEESATSFTGNYFAGDYTVRATVQAQKDSSACLLVRGLGTVRHVLCGLLPGGRAGILRCDRVYETLASSEFAWEPMRNYCLEARVKGARAELWIDGTLIAAFDGLPYTHGMVGVGMPCGGEARFSGIRVQEQDDELQAAIMPSLA